VKIRSVEYGETSGAPLRFAPQEEADAQTSLQVFKGINKSKKFSDRGNTKYKNQLIGADLERFLELCQEAFIAKYRKVDERFWNNSVYASLRRPYYMCNWDQMIAEYHNFIAPNGDIRRYHRIVVDQIPEVDPDIIRSELPKLVRPLTRPFGTFDSETIIIRACKVSEEYDEETRKLKRAADAGAILDFLEEKGIFSISEEEKAKAIAEYAATDKKLFSLRDWKEIQSMLSKADRKELERRRRSAKQKVYHRRKIRGGFKYHGIMVLIIIEKSAEIAFKRMIALIRHFYKRRIIGMLKKLEIQPWEYDHNWANILREEWNVKRRVKSEFSMKIVEYHDMKWISINNIINRGLQPIIKRILQYLVATFLWFSDKLKAVMHEIGQQSILKSVIQPLSDELRRNLAFLDIAKRKEAAEMIIRKVIPLCKGTS